MAEIIFSSNAKEMNIYCLMNCLFELAPSETLFCQWKMLFLFTVGHANLNILL